MGMGAETTTIQVLWDTEAGGLQDKAQAEQLSKTLSQNKQKIMGEGYSSV